MLLNRDDNKTKYRKMYVTHLDTCTATAPDNKWEVEYLTEIFISIIQKLTKALDS